MRRFFLVLLAMPFAASAVPISYDEGSDGDIDGDPSFAFGIGTNQISGSLLFDNLVDPPGTDTRTDFDTFSFSLPIHSQLTEITYSFFNVDLVEGTSELGATFNIQTSDFSSACAFQLTNVAAAASGSVVLNSCVGGALDFADLIGGDWYWGHGLTRTGPFLSGGSWQYSLEFEVASCDGDSDSDSDSACVSVPEPGTLVLLGLGLAGLGLRRRYTAA